MIGDEVGKSRWNLNHLRLEIVIHLRSKAFKAKQVNVYTIDIELIHLWGVFIHKVAFTYICSGEITFFFSESIAYFIYTENH